jgi:hypothetical protein
MTAVETAPIANRYLNPTGRSLIASPLSMAFACCYCLAGVTVLSAVGGCRRNIWSEAQALQCPQRAHVERTRPNGLPRSWPAPSPRWATLTSALPLGCSSIAPLRALELLLLRPTKGLA